MKDDPPPIDLLAGKDCDIAVFDMLVFWKFELGIVVLVFEDVSF